MISDFISELNCISAALLNRDHLDSVMSDLTQDDFYDIRCRKVFIAMNELYVSGNEVDSAMLRAVLEKNNDIGVVTDSFLVDMLNSYSVMNVDGLIVTLKEYKFKRQFLVMSNALGDKAKDKKTDSNEIVHYLHNQIQEIEKTNRDSFKHISEEVNRDLSEFELKKGDYVESGIQPVDEFMSGFINTEFTIVGGRPGTGKSVFGLQSALNVSENDGVLFFSLEMISKLITMRALAHEAKVDSQKIRKGILEDSEVAKLFYAKERLAKRKLHYVDNCVYLDSMCALIRKHKTMYNTALVVVDYIQLVKARGFPDMRTQVAEVSRTFKQMCNDLKIPIIALAQLGRGAEDGVPKLSDLKEAGNLEQDADNVILLSPGRENKNLVNLIFAKNRSGPVGNATMFFNKALSRFENYVGFYDEL